MKGKRAVKSTGSERQKSGKKIGDMIGLFFGLGVLMNDAGSCGLPQTRQAIARAAEVGIEEVKSKERREGIAKGIRKAKVRKATEKEKK